MKNATLSQTKFKPGNSHFWSGVMRVKDLFFKICRKIVGNGERTRFWEYLWVGDCILCKKFLRLYNLSLSKNISVARVFNSDWSCFNFRRNLWGDLAVMWGELKNICSHVYLNEEDKCRWVLNNLVFSPVYSFEE